jgi:hypothetical protein
MSIGRLSTASARTTARIQAGTGIASAWAGVLEASRWAATLAMRDLSALATAASKAQLRVFEASEIRGTTTANSHRTHAIS